MQDGGMSYLANGDSFETISMVRQKGDGHR